MCYQKDQQKQGDDQLSLIANYFYLIELYKISSYKPTIQMKSQQQTNQFSKFIRTLTNNLTSTDQLTNLKNAVLLLQEEPQLLDVQQKTPIITMVKSEIVESEVYDSKQQQQSMQKHEEKEFTLNVQPQQSSKEKQPSVAEEQIENPLTFRTENGNEESKKDRQQLSEPPIISGKRNYTEQSSEKSKLNRQLAQDSRKGNRKSSQESSINLQLTQKTKKSKNLSFTQGKVDSLLYSDATLMYSNDTGFDRQTSNRHPERIQSHKSILNKIQDDDQGDIDTKMERAQSREMQRMRTQSQKASEVDKFDKRVEEDREQTTDVFQTQINDYKSKISKIRELKENKKKKLEMELKRVNDELQELTKKERQGSAEQIPKLNNFQSRLKISDNIQAKVKAQKFVRQLHNNKKSRIQANMGELHVIDKNINFYMQELMKERYKNQERIKQRKKLEIIQRMKQQEMRKIEQQKQKEKNVQFVQQVRGNNNSKANLQPIRKSTENPNKAESVQSKERSPTKNSEIIQQTPELSRKKAYLRKVRNLSFRKDKPDTYEQVLG